MARNKKEDPPVKTDGWMSTFSDLMNLLLCFFVLLFAMSSVDTEKWQKVAASFSSSYSVLDGGSTGIDDGQLIATGASQLTQLGEYYASLGEDAKGEKEEGIEGALDLIGQEGLKESEHMGDVIENMFDKTGTSDAVEVKVTQHYVCLNMKGALMFGSASADLTVEAEKVLDEVAKVLKLYEDHLIEIEGHTDNIPIVHKLYTSNDVLSNYRALAVFNYLVEEAGVSPNNLKHSGRGEYSPIASNDTAEGRAQNRRVEIKIYNSYSNYN